MANTRWPKVVLNLLNECNDQICWKWLKCVETISSNVNLNTDQVKQSSYKKLKTLVESYDEIEWKENMMNKSSLVHYRQFKIKRTKQTEKYLNSLSNFKGVQLKFKARSYTLGLSYEKRKWANADDQDCICPCCKKDVETLEHFILYCECFSVHRKALMQGIRSILCSRGELNLYQDFTQGKGVLCLILGDSTQHYNSELAAEIDKIVKEFLINAIHCRKTYVA